MEPTGYIEGLCFPISEGWFVLLSREEQLVADELRNKHSEVWGRDEKHRRYHAGTSRLAKLGLAVPPELDSLEVVVNWPRVAVEAIVERSDVKTIRRTGELDADAEMLDLFDANNLDSQLPMFMRDKLVYGRAFLSVGSNDQDPDRPLIMVESPREMHVKIDRRSRQIVAALRSTRDKGEVVAEVLYLPNETIWMESHQGRVRVVDRDRHGLGRVPIIMCLNRQQTGRWDGRSEMSDIIPIADAAARTLTNLQYAVEAAAVPRKFAIGVRPEDFVDSNGNPLPQWEAYMGSVWAVANKEAKIGQLAGADLSGFLETVENYGKLASSVTGYPASYFGHATANPAAEGAIRASEARLVKTVERSNSEAGKALAWALDLAIRFKTGEWPAGNRVKVEWHDPGTPTFAQRADAIQKLAGGTPILSREGAWDELGWSEARKEQERQRFVDQNDDPVLSGLMDKVEGLG